jgi:hypothetical protein
LFANVCEFSATSPVDTKQTVNTNCTTVLCVSDSVTIERVGGGVERDDLYCHLRVKNQWFTGFEDPLARSGDGKPVNMHIGVFVSSVPDAGYHLRFWGKPACPSY